MNAQQESKLNMFNAVIAHCDDNAAIVATVPAFETGVNTVVTKVNSITSTTALEAQVITGVAMDKEEFRNSLCRQATDIAAVVFAYAASQNNNELKQQVNFSFTDLRRFRDDELAPTCQNIYNAANDNIAALAPYGITAAMLTAFQDLIEDYSETVPAPRNAVSLRSAYTATLKTLFKEVNDMLKNQLDKIAVQFRAENLEFYNAYKNNRIIIDAATSSTQVAGIITDANSNNPLNGVLVEVVGETFTANSNVIGEYTLKIPVPGVYSLKFSKAEYEDNIINDIEVTLGQSTALSAALEPIPV